MADRAYIDKSYRPIIERMKGKGTDNEMLGLSLVPNKDLFLIAVALGLDNPKNVEKRDGLFLNKDLRPDDYAMISSVLLSTAENDSEIDEFADMDECLAYCEKCAQSGFKTLFNKVEDANWDNEILERRLLVELDNLYISKVEDDIC